MLSSSVNVFLEKWFYGKTVAAGRDLTFYDGKRIRRVHLESPMELLNYFFNYKNKGFMGLSAQIMGSYNNPSAAERIVLDIDSMSLSKASKIIVQIRESLGTLPFAVKTLHGYHLHYFYDKAYEAPRSLLSTFLGASVYLLIDYASEVAETDMQVSVDPSRCPRLPYAKIVKENGETIATPVNPLNLKETLEPEKAVKHFETALSDTPLPPGFSRKAVKLTLKWKALETLKPESKTTKRIYGKKYWWIKHVNEASELKDGRKRLLFYVLIPYWVTVEGRSIEEAISLTEKWVRKQSRRDRISKAWIRSLARNVKNKNIKPWSLRKIREKDPTIHSMISAIIMYNRTQ